MAAKRGRKVSVWVGSVRPGPDVDLLRDLCGVDEYDLDSQEINVDDAKWRRQSVRALIEPVSYSESFADHVVAAAKENGIDKALYVIVQYDFTYSPKKAKRKLLSDPVFLGVFEYDDKGEGRAINW